MKITIIIKNNLFLFCIYLLIILKNDLSDKKLLFYKHDLEMRSISSIQVLKYIQIML